LEESGLVSQESPRILVVDDNPDVAQIMRLATRKLERRVEVVSELNAERALDRLRVESFDLIISDFRMREMDGLEMLAKARPAEAGETRLLFTAYGAKLDPVALAKAHVDGVIEKPMVLDALRVVLDAVLDHEPHTMAALKGALAARTAPLRP
jgi:CheY-like chemotaxis protein